MHAQSSFRTGVCLVAIALFVTLSWSKSIPLDPPDESRGSIGIKIKVSPPAKMGSSHADQVYFVRVEEPDNRFDAESVIQSNYAKGSHVYLLNAKPGKYVAVGCLFSMAGGGGGSVVFSQGDIARTEVEVVPGRLAFMGDIESSSSTKVESGDPAQSHYIRLISPEGSKHGFMARAFTGNYLYTGAFKVIERGADAASAFWAEAGQQHFKNEPAWTSVMLDWPRRK